MSYFISAKGGEPLELTEAEVYDQLSAGLLVASDLVCQAGWTEWKKLSEVFPEVAPLPALPARELPPVQLPPVANPADALMTTPTKITTAVSERPAAVKMQQKAEQFLTPDEFVVATAAQQLTVMSPDGVVLTNRRMLILVPQLGGLKVSFVDWLWSDVVNVHIAEGVLGTTLTVQSVNRPVYGVERLDKAEARAVYRIAQQMEEVVRRGRHHLEMERLRAGSALLRK